MEEDDGKIELESNDEKKEDEEEEPPPEEEVPARPDFNAFNPKVHPKSAPPFVFGAGMQSNSSNDHKLQVAPPLVTKTFLEEKTMNSCMWARDGVLTTGAAAKRSLIL